MNNEIKNKIDAKTLAEARGWLNDIYYAMANDPRYRSSEDANEQLKWQIQLYTPPLQEAIKQVLSEWLLDEDQGKVFTSLAMLDDFHAAEYLLEIEDLRRRIETGQSSIPTIWLSNVEGVIQRLQAAKETQ